MGNEAALSELLSLWEREQARGREVSAADLCRQHPELAPELERRIGALRQMNSLAQAAGETIPFSGQSHPTAPAVTAPLPSLPGYEVLELLGEGGMGVVYLARQAGLNRHVALKMIRRDYTADQAARARLRREAEAVARLAHPHIVSVYAWGEHEGVAYFALEYCSGGNLRDRLVGQPLPPDEAARMVEKLARAVQAAHDAGIIHRDLKPANVLLTPPGDEPALNTPWGVPKVADFGLCRTLEAELQRTAEGTVAGSPQYMAPEQAEGRSRDIGPATDVWALGAILYELLTGQLAFGGTSLPAVLHAVCFAEPMRPGDVQVAVPADLEAICLRCLRKRPADRYPRAADLAEALRGWLTQTAAPRPLTPPNASAEVPVGLAPLAHNGPTLTIEQHPVAVRRRRRRLAAGMLAAAVLAVLAAAGVYRLLPDRTHPEPAQPTPPPTPVVAHAPAPVTVLNLEVHHVANNGGQAYERGVLGKQSFATRRGDSVTVRGRLSAPAYAYLIAFRPDGVDEICFPEKEDEPPPLTDQPRYPSVSGAQEFGLDEGEGLEVFALVASAQPLPSYRQWKAQHGQAPWEKFVQIRPGVVLYDDGSGLVNRLTADDPSGQRGRKEAADKTPLARLTSWLRQAPHIDAVAAVGFPVVPR
jgi:serine/threonine protein kinase